MIRTIVSIFITLGLLIGISFFELHYVQTTFQHFETSLRSLKDKTENGEATYEDGLVVRQLWDEKKQVMHIWIPHSVLYEIDYQLDEAIGFLYVEEYTNALPKIEVLIGLSENVPDGYTFNLGNIF